MDILRSLCSARCAGEFISTIYFVTTSAPCYLYAARMEFMLLGWSFRLACWPLEALQWSPQPCSTIILCMCWSVGEHGMEVSFPSRVWDSLLAGRVVWRRE